MSTSTNPPEPPSKPQDAPSEPPWHASFPQPTLTADIFPRKRALTILSLKIASLLIIDVRRTDYTGGSIRGSLNIPAQGFYYNRGILYELAYKADMEWVVFTCGSSSEGGRARRCAGWFLEHVRNTVGDEDMQVCVLEGGVKGWVRSGEVYRAFMDGYDEREWKDVLALGPPEEEVKKEESAKAGDGKAEAANAGAVAEGTGEVKEKVWSFQAMMGDD